jgi:hypothetical protein
MFWLGIGHLPVVLGRKAEERGDGVVLVGAAVYLAPARRMRQALSSRPEGGLGKRFTSHVIST